MANLRDVIIYLLRTYPNPDELSKPRLVKMVYLADWKSSISYYRQMTEINWFFNHYGPYVEDVINLIKSDKENFSVETRSTFFGGTSHKIRLASKNHTPQLTAEEKQVLDFVIRKTSSLPWNSFIELVYSTYPIENSAKYTNLDLVGLAKSYTQGTPQPYFS